jgi:hypothetical protein
MGSPRRRASSSSTVTELRRFTTRQPFVVAAAAAACIRSLNEIIGLNAVHLHCKRQAQRSWTLDDARARAVHRLNGWKHC